MTMLVGGAVENFRLLALRQALKLEIYGMHKRGRSAYSILKEMGFKGSKEEIFKQLSDIREEFLG